MSRFDEFDRMLLRLEYAGGDVDQARTLAEACRTACASLRYSKAERENIAITIAQIGTSGRVSPDEFRTLRESAPFLTVSKDPAGVHVNDHCMFAIATACGTRPSIRSALSDLVRAAVDQLNREVTK